MLVYLSVAAALLWVLRSIAGLARAGGRSPGRGLAKRLAAGTDSGAARAPVGTAFPALLLFLTTRPTVNMSGCGRGWSGPLEGRVLRRGERHRRGCGRDGRESSGDRPEVGGFRVRCDGSGSEGRATQRGERVESVPGLVRVRA